MDRFLFPVLAVSIILFMSYAMKPTSDLTYTDEIYLAKLQNCEPYVLEGRLNILGNTSSRSIIHGYKNQKCILQTVNVYRLYNSTLATNCALNKTQLNELYEARTNPSMNWRGFTDRSIMTDFKKQGSCISYKLIHNRWSQIQ